MKREGSIHICTKFQSKVPSMSKVLTNISLLFLTDPRIMEKKTTLLHSLSDSFTKSAYSIYSTAYIQKHSRKLYSGT